MPAKITLAEWKRRFHPGQKLICTYRWFWDRPGTNSPKAKRPANDREVVEVLEVRSTQIVTKTPNWDRGFMFFPNAPQLNATEAGFELYFPDGRLMARYEYAVSEAATA